MTASEEAVRTVLGLVAAAGAEPFFIDPEEHDAFVAGVSHLPFVLSAALMNAVSRDASWRDMKTLTAGGFRDTTRLAAGSPAMHRDILLTNREAVTRWIDAVVGTLGEIRQTLASGDETSASAHSTRSFPKRGTHGPCGRPRPPAKASCCRGPLPSCSRKACPTIWAECFSAGLPSDCARRRDATTRRLRLPVNECQRPRRAILSRRARGARDPRTRQRRPVAGRECASDACAARAPRRGRAYQRARIGRRGSGNWPQGLFRIGAALLLAIAAALIADAFRLGAIMFAIASAIAFFSLWVPARGIRSGQCPAMARAGPARR